MKKYILYGHGGSGNHGCEALVRTTSQLIGVEKNKIVLMSDRPEEDHQYGINDLCTIVKNGAIAIPSRTDTRFLKAYLEMRIKKEYKYMSRIERLYGAGANRGDVALSIGGDTYCYGFSTQMREDHLLWTYGGLKTVYWGCSIEPELLQNPLIVEDIKSFDLITARESISYNALKKINSNTYLVADSAFLLPKEEVTLPVNFGNDGIVGINMSPLIENSEPITGIARRNYERLIEYIIDKTAFDILLIPHVIWQHDDDRTVLRSLYEKYSGTGRIILVEDSNCMVLKGYISKCKFFVGARTHATIAAYSTGVPTLVIGYSVKSTGIARDLFGTDEHYVLPVQNLTSESDIVNAFKWIKANEECIRERLITFIPDYIKRVDDGVRQLRRL